LHIVVGVHTTPDTSNPVTFTADGGVDWDRTKPIIDPWDEYAIEEAIIQAKAKDGQVTAIAIGPAWQEVALKHALTVGIKNVIRIWDDGWSNLDSRGYSAIFAAAVQKLGDVDLVIFGKEAAGQATDAHIFQTGRRLGWSQLSMVSLIAALDEGRITATQLMEEGQQTASAPLPAVINVLKGINEPRYPSLMGIRKAAKAEIPVWTAADLDVTVPTPKVRTLAYADVPTTSAACEIITGDGVEAQAATLADRLQAEKVV
jgi:electron transfer flavoprotein beta subunit